MALASALLKRYFVATASSIFANDNRSNKADGYADVEAGINNKKTPLGVVKDDSGKLEQLSAWDSVQFERKGDKKHGKPVVAQDWLDAFQEAVENEYRVVEKVKEGRMGKAGERSKSSRLCVDFNVSHQAGLVVLVGTTEPDVEVGVDVTCVDERGDMESIAKRGFGSWVDVYEQVLSPEEVRDLKAWVGDETVHALESGQEGDCLSPKSVIKDKVRRFYTLWACKEAYLKMTGDALLATYVQKLEFEGFRAPKPAEDERDGPWGEKVTGTVPKIAGELDRNTEIGIQAFEKNYIMVTAIRSRHGRVDGNAQFSFLDIDDIVALAIRQRHENRASNANNL